MVDNQQKVAGRPIAEHTGFIFIYSCIYRAFNVFDTLEQTNVFILCWFDFY